MEVIPHNQLQPDTLRNVIEEVVTREGAVHGHHDQPLEKIIASVMRQLDSGDLVLIFDPESETCSLLPPAAVIDAMETEESERTIDPEP